MNHIPSTQTHTHARTHTRSITTDCVIVCFVKCLHWLRVEWSTFVIKSLYTKIRTDNFFRVTKSVFKILQVMTERPMMNESKLMKSKWERVSRNDTVKIGLQCAFNHIENWVFLPLMIQTQHETSGKTWKKNQSNSFHSIIRMDDVTHKIDKSLEISLIFPLKHKSAHNFTKFSDKYWFYSNLTHKLELVSNQ